jgi:hypothetical protein
MPPLVPTPAPETPVLQRALSILAPVLTPVLVQILAPEPILARRQTPVLEQTPVPPPTPVPGQTSVLVPILVLGQTPARVASKQTFTLEF